ncbi:MAG TPA: cyclic nucleotide-binding domain-containing protein [Gaiellaceae bacterium]|nr:cyclic nucleotide-binding domain-containing protein [Gaiellaceae bacterium]
MRFSKNSKVAAMARIPLFCRLSKSELARIAQLADEVDLPPGKSLTKEGSRGREFFVLLEGSADVQRNGRRIATMGVGDFFGEIALVTDVPRTATVTTTSPVHALVITDRAFRGLLRDSPAIQGKVLEAVASRLAHSL